MEIAAGEQLGFTLFEPLLRLSSMTFRTRPVATAVETPELLATIVALMQLPASFLGATGRDVRNRSILGWHHRLPVLRPILGSEATDDVGQFDAWS